MGYKYILDESGHVLTKRRKACQYKSWRHPDQMDARDKHVHHHTLKGHIFDKAIKVIISVSG